MLDQVRSEDAEALDLPTYRADFDKQWSHITTFYKLERLQHFRQPENKSWRAFADGQWTESLHITQAGRAAVEREYAADKLNGQSSYRVRVVEFPITPYLQWEMWRFKVRVESGENIRIIESDVLSAYEREFAVPELIFMDNNVMYEIIYNEHGILAGSRKFTDSALTAGCLTIVQKLYAEGEDFQSFFTREIEPLTPPAVNSEFEFIGAE